MSQGPSSSSDPFVFGAPKITKPVSFTFSTNGDSEHSSKSQIPPTPLPTESEEKPEERPDPLNPQDVKEAQEELEHLQKECDQSRDHEVRTAPLITREAYIAGGFAKHSVQYSVIGEVLSIQSRSTVYKPMDPRLYVNTNAPFTAVICGVQGSGKSHTVSILLENMFIPKLNSIGMLSKPLAGLVLRSGGPRPSEVAWVGVPSDGNPNIKTPPMRVYVPMLSLDRMKAVYKPLGKHVEVMPLLFNESELDATAFLTLMCPSEVTTLYNDIVLRIVQDLGDSFSYQRFLCKLEEEKSSWIGMTSLKERLSLVDSFIDRQTSQCPPRFAAGKLTIIDLSDSSTELGFKCGLFEVLMIFFVRAELGTGKVLVVDEAHRYLSSRGAAGLTGFLLALTRNQRHLGMRVLISTQEPTVIPVVLLELCTIAIIHRFSSPRWWRHLEQHMSIDATTGGGFDKVVRLQTGEAIVLAPSGMGVFPDDSRASKNPTDERFASGGASREEELILGPFGQRLILLKTRARVTKDGGASVLVSESEV